MPLPLPLPESPSYTPSQNGGYNDATDTGAMAMSNSPMMDLQGANSMANGKITSILRDLQTLAEMFPETSSAFMAAAQAVAEGQKMITIATQPQQSMAPMM